MNEPFQSACNPNILELQLAQEMSASDVGSGGALCALSGLPLEAEGSREGGWLYREVGNPRELKLGNPRWPANESWVYHIIIVIAYQ